LQRVQSYSWQRDVAVADQLEFFLVAKSCVGDLASNLTRRVTMEAGVLQAAWEDAISNKLIPRSTRSTFSKHKRLVLNCRLNKAQCIDEVDFGGCMRTDLCIYVHLDER